MIRKRGKFFEYEFMEGGKRFSGTFNGKKDKLAASIKEARDFEWSSELRSATAHMERRKIWIPLLGSSIASI